MGCCYSSTIPDKAFNRSWRDGLPDMTGKVVAITGCTSGTGYVAAMECRTKGATVLMLNRASARAQAALAAVLSEGSSREDWRASPVGRAPQPVRDGRTMPELDDKKAVHVDCDLMSLDSVRQAAAKVLSIVGEGGLDVLCLNAGIDHGKGDTPDGYDVVIQVNHLAQMLLLSELHPALEAAASKRREARVVLHTSMARMVVGMPKILKQQYKQADETVKTIPACAFAKAPREWPEDVKMLAKSDVIGTYGLSKAVNFCMWWALHEKLQAKGSGVKSLLAHPGTAATPIFAKKFGKPFMFLIGNMLVRGSAHSDADGACPLLTCIASAVESGDFYAPKGTDLMLDFNSQTKGPTEKVVLTDWERAVMAQGAAVWAHTFAALSVQFEI
jgi:NAD(P)-dependent dehydrogenase (short-subunit alcohol dehydrogenase family)